MRLAYVCLDRGIPVPGHGSASIHVGEFTAALARAGHEVVVFCVNGDGTLPGRKKVKIRPIRGTTELRDFLRVRERFALGKELWSLMLNPAIVQAIRSEHERAPFDGIIERLALWGYGAGTLSRLLGIPHVLEVNSPILWEQAAYRELLLEVAAGAVHDHLARQTDAIFTVSEALAEDYRRLTGVPVSVLPNGVDVERFNPAVRAQPRPRWARGFVAGFIGTMKPFHDLETVAAAAELLPPGVRVVMIGSGPGVARLAETPAALAGKLLLPGPVLHDEVPGVLGWFDLGLVPATSGHPYLSPLKLPEYLAVGLPVVVAAGSQADQLVEEPAKAVYESGDRESLAAAIIAIARSRGRDRMARSARAQAEERSWDAAARIVALKITDLTRTASERGPLVLT